jgi:large subunit ribosomal protein L24
MEKAMPRKFKPALAQKKSKIKIKKGDKIVVIAGKSKGKEGRVLRVIVDKSRVLVEGVNMVKKHVKANPQTGQQGGILEQEAALHISNVMLLDSDGKKTRVGFSVADGKKTRVARSNGAEIVEKKTATAKTKK